LGIKKTLTDGKHQYILESNNNKREAKMSKTKKTNIETTIRIFHNGAHVFFETYEQAKKYCKKNKGSWIDGTKGVDGKWYSY
jgi:hypothetical protein